ncbi:MAG: hypothetical protein U1F10_04380 [Burkholderiales bacterium]
MADGQRTVFGRTFAVTPLAAWAIQRLSGLALAPMIVLHATVPAIGRNRFFLAVLLALVCFHGVTALVRLRRRTDAAGRARAGALAWTIVVAVAGGLVVVAGKLNA